MRRALAWLVLVLSLLNTGFGPPVLRERDFGGLRLYPSQLRAMQRPEPPEVNARAFLLADYSTGTVILARNEREPLPPASLTKVMTALIALERASPEEVVVVSERAAQAEGMRMGLLPGQKVRLRTLLYGLLLLSANDAAVAIAEHVAGSVDAFVELMNARAAELGMRDTHFVNPHGLDAEGHLSSAYDLFLLARYALANETFASIVASQALEDEGYRFENSNRLLRLYPGADGVKTGTTEAAGECLIASATRGNRRGIAIVLDSPDRYGEAATLLEYYFNNFAVLPVEAGPPPLDSWVGPDGIRRYLSVEGDGALLLEKWQFFLVRPFRWVELAPDGGVQGRMEFYLGDEVIESRPLVGAKP